MNKKYLQKIVEKLVEDSCSNNKTNRQKINQSIKLLKKLPITEGIFTLDLFLKRVKNILNKSTLKVESALPLNESEKKSILKTFNSHLLAGKSVSIAQFSINPTLLGGIKVQIGDTLIDGSVKRKIYQIKEAIVESRNY